jgi:hypothetical protein
MSEMRQLLRYEIPSLFLFIEIFWAIACFVDVPSFARSAGIEYKDISAILTALLALLLVISIPIGWFLYQLYDAFYSPHYRKKSIELLRSKINLPKGDRAEKESNYEELVDMILFNDKYGNKDLFYNVGSYWDHHDARYVVGSMVPLFSLLIIIYILYFLHDTYRLVIMPWRSENVYPSINLIFLISFNLLLYFFIFKPHNRILDEIDARERYLILFKQKELETIKENPGLEDIFGKKDDP